MREVIQSLNKKSLSDATGIPYSRLRKFASNQIKKLSPEAIELIYQYLIKLSQVFGGSNETK